MLVSLHVSFPMPYIHRLPITILYKHIKIPTKSLCASSDKLQPKLWGKKDRNFYFFHIFCCIVCIWRWSAIILKGMRMNKNIMWILQAIFIFHETISFLQILELNVFPWWNFSLFLIKFNFVIFNFFFDWKDE